MSAVWPEPRLTKNEAMVIRLRFGLGGLGERTLKEVAAALMLSESRIRAIEKTALSKLRRSETLRSYWEEK